MKKTILAMLLAGCSCAVFAQDETMSTTKLSTSSNYDAYSTFTATPPETVRNYVVRDYPAATTIRWRQSSPDWWHGYYVTNNQPTHVYYMESFHVPTAGQSFTVSLPVRQSYVPENVVTRSIDLFGPTLYDINAYKGTNKEEIYVVRILENGALSNHYIDVDGNKALAIYRLEAEENNAAMSNMAPAVDATITEEAAVTDVDDGTKVKIKTKTSDGKETKTKIKNGKIKTKED